MIHSTVEVWRSEDSLEGLVLSSHYVGSEDQTQVIRPGSKHLSPRGHATDPDLVSFFFDDSVDWLVKDRWYAFCR